MIPEESRVSFRVTPEPLTGARPAAHKLVASARSCDDLIVDMSHTLASAPSFFQGIVESIIYLDKLSVPRSGTSDLP